MVRQVSSSSLEQKSHIQTAEPHNKNQNVELYQSCFKTKNKNSVILLKLNRNELFSEEGENTEPNWVHRREGRWGRGISVQVESIVENDCCFVFDHTCLNGEKWNAKTWNCRFWLGSRHKASRPSWQEILSLDPMWWTRHLCEQRFHPPLFSAVLSSKQSTPLRSQSNLLTECVV